MSTIGSDSWQGADGYDEGDELHTRATRFLATIKWDTMLAVASKARAGIECELSEKYSLGHFNLVRKLVFKDGVCWVARLRLPILQNIFGDREALDVRSSMMIEIATTNYLRQKTTIPVPEIFSHDLNPNNEVGAPYLLLSYLPGNVASELASARECGYGVFGTPTQNERFWQQMADIHVQLASLQFDKIGSLYQDGDTFTIGPEIETGKGPWSNAEEYYVDLAQHSLKVAEQDAHSDVRESDSFNLPRLFPKLMHLYGKPNQKNFGLVNRDFGVHNVLVNDDFEIIGLIDLDGVMAAPIELVAQLPSRMGLNRPAPGHVETRPGFLKRMEMEKPLFGKYVEMFMRAAAKSGNEKSGEVADWLLSDSASIVQGLVKYGAHQLWVNEMWMGAYKRLLSAKEVEGKGS